MLFGGSFVWTDIRVIIFLFYLFCCNLFCFFFSFLLSCFVSKENEITYSFLKYQSITKYISLRNTDASFGYHRCKIINSVFRVSLTLRVYVSRIVILRVTSLLICLFHHFINSWKFLALCDNFHVPSIITQSVHWYSCNCDIPAAGWKCMTHSQALHFFPRHEWRITP
jgi:hypothetical protein